MYNQETKISDQRYILENGLLGEITTLLKHYSDTEEDVFSGELSDLLHESVRQMAFPYKKTSSCMNLNYVDVLSLGRKCNNEGECDKDAERAAVLRAAHALASDGRFFSIRYSSGTNKLSFSVAVPETNPLHLVGGILRAAFRHVSLCDSEKSPADACAFHSSAVCRLCYMDNNTCEQQVSWEQVESWVDSVAAALPTDIFSVEMMFEPIHKAWLSEQLSALNKLQGMLEEFAETSWQVSGNIGSGISETDQFYKEFIKNIAGTTRENGNYGMSASLSLTLRRADARQISEYLKFSANQISQMQRNGGHAVSIMVHAADNITLNAVQSVLTGSLSKNGLSVQWKPKKNTAEEIASIVLPDPLLPLLLGFPEKNFPGFTRNDVEEYDVTGFVMENGQNNGELLEMGQIFWNGLRLDKSFSIPLTELNRHAFICGMTGAGKTNTICHLISVVNRPFLVIEPVKGEYRSLKGSIPNMEVYTMDVGEQDMLSLNPLWFPMGSSLQYHIDSIKTIIASAFDLYAAMPNILEQCLFRVYISRGWNLVTSRNIYEKKLPEEQLYPTISDLCSEIERYLNSSDFESETKGNYKGALLCRLQSFTSGAKGIILNKNAHMPFGRWLNEKTNVVIELDALADDADKCIVMGTILTQYFQYVKYCANDAQSHGLRHLLVLEEAHHLFTEDSNSQDGSSSRKQLAESLSNLLAEIRAYGEGVLIVDQSPTRISPEVIKNTAVKIVHRINYEKDIELLRDALLLRNGDRTTASLDRGCALIRCGCMRKPALVGIPLCESKERFSLSKSAGNVSGELCLIKSIMDAMLLNVMFRTETKIACGLFVNQALFDKLSGIREAIRLLCQQLNDLIYSHGYWEISEACSIDKLMKQIILYGTSEYVNEAYLEQKFLCSIVKLYLNRLLELVDLNPEKPGMRSKEWELMLNYRETQIHQRLIGYYACDLDPEIMELCFMCNCSSDYKYIGILQRIIKRLDKETEMLIKAESNEKYKMFIEKSLYYNFYVMPEQYIMDIALSVVKKFITMHGDK